MFCNEVPDVPLKDKHAPKAFFAEERKGWHGYVEWEKYPEKQKKAADILAQYKFAQVNWTSFSPGFADADCYASRNLNFNSSLCQIRTHELKG